METYQRVTLVYAIFSFATVLTDPVFSLFLSQQGYSPIWLSIILSSFSIVAMVVTPIIGGISDTWGKRPLMIMGIGLNVIAYGLYVLAPHPFVIFIGRGIEGIGYYLVTLVAVSKLQSLAEGQKGKNQTEKVGMSLSIGKLGYVVGPLVGGILAFQYGILSPFLATAMVMLALGIWYISLPQHAYPKLPAVREMFNPIPRIKEFLRIRPFRGLSIMVIVFNYSLAALYVFLPIHIVQNLHLGFEQVGLALFVQQIPMLFQFIGGKITDKMGSKKVMLLGIILTSLGIIGVGLSKSYDWLLIALLINGIGQSIFGISTLSLITSIARKLHREATFLGSQVSISRIGTFVGYMTIGLVVAASDIQTLFILCGALLLVGTIVAEEFLIAHPEKLPSPFRNMYMILHPHH